MCWMTWRAISGGPWVEALPPDREAPEDAMVDANYKFRAFRRSRRGKGWQGHVRVRVRLAQLQPLYRWYLRQAGGVSRTKHSTDVESPPPSSRVCMNSHPVGKSARHAPMSVRVVVLNDPAARWRCPGGRISSWTTRCRG